MRWYYGAGTRRKKAAEATAAARKRLPPFPTRQMFVLSTSLQAFPSILPPCVPAADAA